MKTGKVIAPIFTGPDDIGYKDKFDMYKDLLKVHSPTKRELTSDVVLARFRESKDKTYIIDMAYCGQYCKAVVDSLIANHNKMVEDGFSRRLTDLEVTELNRISMDIFNLFMNRISVLSLVNRNEEDNFLIRYLTGQSSQSDEQIAMSQNEESEAIKKLKEAFKNKEVKE